MHARFPAWLKEIEPSADGDLLASRWTAAAAWAEHETRDAVTTELKLYSLESPPNADVEDFSQFVLEYDPSIPPADNLQLLRVLAGAAIAARIEEGGLSADATALGVAAIGYPSGRAALAVPEVVQIARRHLEERGGAIRPDDFGDPLRRLSSVASKMGAISGADAVPGLAAATAVVIPLVASNVSRLRSDVQSRLVRLAEENQFLWWVLAERSTELNRWVSDLTVPEYALVAAREASNRTFLVPPSPSIGSLLARMLRVCKGDSTTSSSIADLVEATSVEWREALIADVRVDGCQSLTPLTCAVEKSQELAGSQDWGQAVSHACPGMDVSEDADAVEVAQHFLVELQFLRALKTLD